MEYVAAGADLLETNTFGANRFKLAMHGLEGRVRDINRAGVRLARDVRETMGRDVLVLGSIGPLGKYLLPLGTLGEAEAGDAFREQAEALLEGGVDGFVAETFSDLRELRLAVGAIRAVSADLPVWPRWRSTTSASRSGAGPRPRWLATSRTLPVQVIGANCAWARASSTTSGPLHEAAPDPGVHPAERRTPEPARRAADLSLVAGLHGRLRLPHARRRDAHRRRLLRHHPGPHPGDARGGGPPRPRRRRVAARRVGAPRRSRAGRDPGARRDRGAFAAPRPAPRRRVPGHGRARSSARPQHREARPGRKAPGGAGSRRRRHQRRLARARPYGGAADRAPGSRGDGPGHQHALHLPRPESHGNPGRPPGRPRPRGPEHPGDDRRSSARRRLRQRHGRLRRRRDRSRADRRGDEPGRGRGRNSIGEPTAFGIGVAVDPARPIRPGRSTGSTPRWPPAPCGPRRSPSTTSSSSRRSWRGWAGSRCRWSSVSCRSIRSATPSSCTTRCRASRCPDAVRARLRDAGDHALRVGVETAQAILADVRRRHAGAYLDALVRPLRGRRRGSRGLPLRRRPRARAPVTAPGGRSRRGPYPGASVRWPGAAPARDVEPVGAPRRPRGAGPRHVRRRALLLHAPGGAGRRGHQGRAAGTGRRPPAARPQGRGGVSYMWLVESRNKKSITCNLREPDGQALITRLAGAGGHPGRELPSRHHGEVEARAGTSCRGSTRGW